MAEENIIAKSSSVYEDDRHVMQAPTLCSNEKLKEKRAATCMRRFSYIKYMGVFMKITETVQRTNSSRMVKTGDGSRRTTISPLEPKPSCKTSTYDTHSARSSTKMLDNPEMKSLFVIYNLNRGENVRTSEAIFTHDKTKSPERTQRHPKRLRPSGSNIAVKNPADETK